MDRLFEQYAAFKMNLSDRHGITEELAHVHAGLLIFSLVALISRHRMQSWLPVASVYALALGNELIDFLGPGATASPCEPVFDILNTVAWPSVLFFLARRASQPGQRRRENP